ncbi:MAG: response regulator, partial [Rhodospirillales bacterium]|nr:response regulator [Rhodospirillales bacterium]
NATNRDVTARFLSQAGHTVIPVADGPAALKALEATEVDVVITDLRMPEMNGVLLAQAIRSLPGARGRTPILLLTADALARQAPGWSAAEIDLVLTKPFARAELLAAIGRAAGPRRPSEAGSAAEGTAPATDATRPAGNAAVTRTKMADADAATAGSPSVAPAAGARTPERLPPPPLLDEAILADVAQALGKAVFADHVRVLAGRIADLLVLLRAGAAGDPVALGDQAHETAGAAGIMGLLALSFALREAVIAQRFDDPALIPLFEHSLGALRRCAATREAAAAAE